MKHRFDLFLHVEIGVGDLHLHKEPSEFLVHAFGKALQQRLPFFKLHPVVIPDEKRKRGPFHIALHFSEMEETLIVPGFFRHFRLGHSAEKFHGQPTGIHHHSICTSGVHIHTLKKDLGGGGVEILIYHFPLFPSVHCIGIRRSEFLYIKAIGALAHFLIGRKTDGNPTVGQIFVFQPFKHGKNFGNARLIVRTKQGRAVGGD